MPTLSPAVRGELEKLLSGLEAKIADLHEQAEAVRRVLGVRAAQRMNGRKQDFDEIPSAPTHNYEGMTMREVVKAELRDHPGWKAADVTNSLRKKGYTRGGETRFSHRVYNEIWRLHQDEQVQKDAKGGWRLVAEDK